MCLWGVNATVTNFGLAQTTEPRGHKPLIVNVVVVGAFEEEEEGIGVASDIVKAMGEDPDTLSSDCLWDLHNNQSIFLTKKSKR